MRLPAIASVIAVLSVSLPAYGQNLDHLIAKHAAANNVPEHLVRRVIHIESRGRPHLVSKGNYGLMQIRLGTARAMGYRGSAQGLLDADTNMTYAVKYLAGAYRAAGGNADRAVRYYQRGYYHQAKAKGFSPYRTASAQNPAVAETTPAQPAAAATTSRASAQRKGQPFNLLTYLSQLGTPRRAAAPKAKRSSAATKLPKAAAATSGVMPPESRRP